MRFFFFFFDNIATLNFNLYQFERNSVYKKLLFLGILLNPYAIFADEQKLKGLVMLGGGVRIIESHLFPQPKDYLGSRQDKPNVYYQPIPLIGLDVTYNSVTKAKDSIFLKGFSGRNLGGLKLGYAITYGNHKSEFAIISSIYERAYANPYIEGNRKEKALNKYGFNFTQTYMFSPLHNFFINYIFQHHDYKGESIPYPSLRRNKSIHEGEIGYQFMFLKIVGHYDYGEAKGEAESYRAYGGKASITIPLMNTKLILKPSVGYFKYTTQAINPIFNKIRSGVVTQYSFSMYKTHFLHPHVLIFASYKKEKRGSNIAFYKEDYQYIMSGLGYSF